ncbi:ABC transporter permease [Cytobacillus spongiae]|uniref:ABC transporter permease n=1 Tax=Cytobacillus spongiae TaxID=2901381 RepID=UPI001F213CE2|nr:ABC transporter permease [Cytobacillus spongiae]UII56890.1 ABC transporter permease [Cytobacillus spongiae]
MFDEKKLWKERFSSTNKELGRYLRYIFNGHLVIVLVFLLGTAAYYYQEWLRTLPTDFPAAIVLAVFLGGILTYSPVYTYLLEADRIFLLPLETKLGNYFKRSIGISFVFQVYLITVGLAVFMPMYAHVNHGSFRAFVPFLLVISAVKLVNILIKWRVQFYVEKRVHVIDSCIRYFINGSLLYFLFANASPLYAGLIWLMLLGLYFYYSSQTKNMGLKWGSLIEQEEKRMAAFYRLANMFTDVPQLRNSVKRRKWLDWLFGTLPYVKEKTYSHLYARTFLRAGDYFGLFIRLTIIGALVIYFISFGYGQLLFVLLFLYLTGFQLLPLWMHYQNKLWVMLYPIKEADRLRSFQRLLVMVLGIQSLFLSLPILLKGDLLIGLLAIFSGWIFTYFYVFIYSQQRLKL